mmetsp:Transcript_7961/g.24438  ORF Transcript_7961/g.24438 Transcript_7961/m.24438 type:complete len:232 (+) Transcript_7961:756-1451(+)
MMSCCAVNVSATGSSTGSHSACAALINHTDATPVVATSDLLAVMVADRRGFACSVCVLVAASKARPSSGIAWPRESSTSTSLMPSVLTVTVVLAGSTTLDCCAGASPAPTTPTLGRSSRSALESDGPPPTNTWRRALAATMDSMTCADAALRATSPASSANRIEAKLTDTYTACNSTSNTSCIESVFILERMLAPVLRSTVMSAAASPGCSMKASSSITSTLSSASEVRVP